MGGEGISEPVESCEATPASKGEDALAASSRRASFKPHERLLILDIWQRSELGARELGPLVGVSAHTLYDWKKRFDQRGPAGLEDRPRGKPATGSRLPEATQRAILMLKCSHADWGVDRIQNMLFRGEGFAASTGAIQRVLVDAGYEIEAVPTRPHPEPRVQSFERARPNQLWQSDLFTFTLKRENHRVWLVAFLDDHSRFVVGHGVHGG